MGEVCLPPTPKMNNLSPWNGYVIIAPMHPTSDYLQERPIAVRV